MSSSTSDCPHCAHPFDPHHLVAIEPMDGGIILCPEPDCECISTWGPPDVTPKPALVALLLVKTVPGFDVRARMWERLGYDN